MHHSVTIGELDDEFEAKVWEIQKLDKGQVKGLVDGPIGTTWVLQHLGSEVDRFKDWEMEMKDRLSMSMDQH
jgi:hypothetical protein